MTKQKLISGFFISLLLFCAPVFLFAQVPDPVSDTLAASGDSLAGPREILADSKKEKEKKPPHIPVGLRLGLDLSRGIVYALNRNRINIEGSLDIDFKPNLFAVIEGGWDQTLLADTAYSYKCAGPYFRLGIDYNLLKLKDPKDGNAIVVGFRYGFSVFNQQVDNIVFRDSLWGDHTTSIPRSMTNSHWGELLFGAKGEIVKNFFAGWSVRLRLRFAKGGDAQLTPYLIPGYGLGANALQIGANFYLYYRITWGKTKKKIKL